MAWFRKKKRTWSGPLWQEQMWPETIAGPVAPRSFQQLKWPNIFKRMARRMVEIFKPNVSWTEHEAFYCLIAAAAWADGKVQAEEDLEMKALANRSPTLSKVPDSGLKDINRRIVRRLNADFQGAVERACSSLPEKMRRSAFCHAVDIVYADRQVLPEEARYLNKLVELLGVDVDEAKSIAATFETKNEF